MYYNTFTLLTVDGNRRLQRASSFLLALLLFLSFSSLRAQAPPPTIDFEDFSGTLTSSPELDALGISFGSPSVDVDNLPLNGTLGPVNVQEWGFARSGKRAAANCSSGIGCEFPSGAVSMEFAVEQPRVTFYLSGFAGDAHQFLIYGYDDSGEIEQLARANQTGEWQFFSFNNVKGLIIDVSEGAVNRYFLLEDLTYDPEPAGPSFECATADYYLQRLEIDPIFRENIRRVEELTERYIQNIAEEDIYGFGSEVITIPVVVHVVYNNATENVSDAQVQSQIDALNELFRATNSGIGSIPSAFAPLVSDLRIQFELARRDPDCNPTTGITRTSTSVTAFTKNSASSTATVRNPVKFSSSGGRDAWPSDEYLNLWVCDLSGGLLGYASFPADLATRPAEDGVVMDYTAFGTQGTAAAPFNLGRVCGHEIGHWLNLRHIWGDDQNEPDVCSLSDFVDDTPNQGVANTGCPTFPDVSCMNGPNGDLFMNQMDYTNDVCRTMFTLGQHVRAAATLFGVRASLIGSDGLVAPPDAPSPDLWSQDTPDDVGDEPNNSAFPMYRSADIWVRNTNDGLVNQEHQNPVYRASNAPNYVYVRVRNRGCSGNQNGTTRLYWAKAGSGLSWPSPWDGSVVSPALMGDPIGSQNVSLSGGEFTILEFQWVVPNPADYVTIPGDASHFCLLARTETPGGMTFPETANLYQNVLNNNNIVWKNVSVSTEDDGGGFVSQVIVGNFFEQAQLVRLQFDLPPDEIRSLFDYGRVILELNDLNELWEEGGQEGEAIEPLGDGSVELLKPGGYLDNIPLRPGALHGINVRWIPNDGPGINNVFKLNMTQIDLRQEAIIGGNQFRFKTLAKGVIRPGTGNGNGNNTPPVFVDCPKDVPRGCEFPIGVRVDMSNVPAPDNFLGNFTIALSWDPSLIEYVGPAEIQPPYVGFINVDPAAGKIVFNGADPTGVAGNVSVFEAYFKAIGPAGSAVQPQLELLTLASAGTFRDLRPDAIAVMCTFNILPTRLLGDVNGDGLINSTDAAIILAFSVGNPIPADAAERIQAGVGDVNDDGATNPTDALIILTYDVGLPVDFPIGSLSGCGEDNDGLTDQNAEPRSSIRGLVHLGRGEEEQGLITLPLIVRPEGEKLGSYQVELSWDPSQWAYRDFGPGEHPAFRGSVRNEAGVHRGRLIIAQANPFGAAGKVHVGALQLERLDPNASAEESIDLRVLNLSTAETFRPIIPSISVGLTLAPDAEIDENRLRVFPNPFSVRTVIEVALTKAAAVDLSIVDLSGREVAVVQRGELSAGLQRIDWDGRSSSGTMLPNGVYLLRGSLGDRPVSRRLVLLR